jgi:hypothetical protein
VLQVMEEKRLETIALENGLCTILYDGSRPVAGDRWLVRLVARVVVGVEPVLSDLSRAGLDPAAVQKRLGTEAVYEYVSQRRFVDEKDKETALTLQKEAFLETVAGYLANPAFASRFIAKKYREAEEQAKWVSEGCA